MKGVYDDGDSAYESLRDEFDATLSPEDRRSIDSAEFWRRFREWDKQRRSKHDRRRNDHARDLLNELRQADRAPLVKLLREYSHRVEALQRAVAERTDYARRCERECDRLRVIVREQARLLDRSVPSAQEEAV